MVFDIYHFCIVIVQSKQCLNQCTNHLTLSSFIPKLTIVLHAPLLHCKVPEQNVFGTVQLSPMHQNITTAIQWCFACSVVTLQDSRAIWICCSTIISYDLKVAHLNSGVLDTDYLYIAMNQSKTYLHRNKNHQCLPHSCIFRYSISSFLSNEL